jgi:hypothetical protein
MAQVTRRSWIKSNAGLAAAAGAASIVPRRVQAMRQGKIILSHVLRLNEPERLKLCLQMGVSHVVSTPSLRGIGPDQYEAAAYFRETLEWLDRYLVPVKGTK